ncbi:hypothetical protein DFH07DRAFT_904775 [Mycena maculata]|uniref:NAD(P)-binding domain-containing protein n=1 Tax=Mycena maculata TaxID=230809 RepID=A0AAD7INK9_9AGAR|nr:hypothetical protein DFH07DRAFT_904775 [Mycena maculata]
MTSLKLTVLAAGASRNIGYLSAIRLLGATVTFLRVLRSPAIFDDDILIQGHIKSRHVRLEEDTRRAWNEAGVVDVFLFSVGKQDIRHSQGFVIDKPSVCAQGILNVGAPQPRIVGISSTGLTPTVHAALPLLLKPLYAMLSVPHKDKIGMERVLAHCAGWAWNSEADSEPAADIVGEGWRERQGPPGPGTLKRVLVIRPALLADGQCHPAGDYRVSEKELGGYTISRKDTAHLVVDALARWDEFENKRISVA